MPLYTGINQSQVLLSPFDGFHESVIETHLGFKTNLPLGLLSTSKALTCTIPVRDGSYSVSPPHSDSFASLHKEKDLVPLRAIMDFV